MFKKYEHRRIVFGDGKLANNDFKVVNNNTLIEFVQRYSLPFVVNFDHDSAQKAFRGWVDHHLLIFASRQNHSLDLINQQAQAVAKRDEFYMKVFIIQSLILSLKINISFRFCYFLDDNCLPIFSSCSSQLIWMKTIIEEF